MAKKKRSKLEQHLVSAVMKGGVKPVNKTKKAPDYSKFNLRSGYGPR